MKQFISVEDVTDIDALVKKALAYKANPFKDKSLYYENHYPPEWIVV